MRKITLLISILAIMSACSGSKTPADTPLTIAGKQWTFTGTDTKGKNVTLTFDETTKKVSGFSGCNQYNGNYTRAGNTIFITNVAATKMYCPNAPQEATFLTLLQKVNNFKQVGNTLILSEGNLELLTFNIN